MFEPAIFSESDRLKRIFPTAQNGLEKRKILYLVKLVSKWKRATRKGHTNVLLFRFLDLKLVPIDSALNPASCYLIHWFQKCRRGTKQPKLKNPVKIFLKCPLWSIAAKLENVRTKTFLQIYRILSNCDSNPLICDPVLFPGKNSPNIAKSNRAFPGNVKGDRALVLTRLNCLMAEGFSTTAYIFQFSHLHGETGGQSWIKSGNFASVSFS